MLNNQLENFVWPAEFACTIILDNQVVPNMYAIHLGLEPLTDKSEDVNLGFKKLKFFVSNYLQNSLIINLESPIIKPLSSLDTNLVLLPAEPYDYIVAVILFRKFTAICKKYFDISFLTVDSIVGDRVQYTLVDCDNTDKNLEGDYWWNMDSVNTGINDQVSWDDLNLKESPKFSPIVIKGGLSEE